jgi:hypothetical protein
MNRLRRTSRVILGVGMAASSAFAQKPPAAAPAAAATAAAPATPAAAPAPAPFGAAGPHAAPAAEAAPTVEVPPDAPVPPPVVAPPTRRIACLVGDHPKEYSDSARTATGLVCDALRDKGVDIGQAAYDPGGSTSAYVVNLDQLGSTFFLRVTFEDPIGQPQKTRRVSLYDLSEAEVAAPRVANAMTDAKSVDDANYDNVVGSEQRQKGKKTGEFVIGGGIAAISMPAAGSPMGPALNLFGFYETRDWGIGLQGHFGDAATERNNTASFMALSVGARYYFSDQNITPLVGGGLALSTIEEHKQNAYYSLRGGGTSAFAEVGAEFFRLHKTHLIATVRVDAPFYTLTSSTYSSYNYYGYCSGLSCPASVDPGTAPKSRYEVPITVNLGIGF